MALPRIYEPRYSGSAALVIGINDYRRAPPLGYARQDAEAVAAQLATSCEFPPGTITRLLDTEATHAAIRAAIHLFTRGDRHAENDRVFVFFAGHGHTAKGQRGEVGFLVPADGDPRDLGSLIRWDELTKTAELMPAKHVLFIMDACYGGLALTRSLPPGATRFARDMLQRFSRQVITAGKADERVADQGGPRDGHSVFTGHFLDALEGKARSSDGVMSANAVMAYVYERVAKDYASYQTPHYGFLDGDGDFLFNPSVVAALEIGKEGADLAIEVPPTLVTPEVRTNDTPTETVKVYLADPSQRIKLDDLVTGQLRRALHGLRSELFPTDSKEITAGTFGARVRAYEGAAAELMQTITLLGKWADPMHLNIISRALARIVERPRGSGGYLAWIGLQWYPELLLAYAAGIAAVSSDNYPAFRSIIAAPVLLAHRDRVSQDFVVAVVEGTLDVERADGFKLLPGHERKHVPRSEYMFNTLQPTLDDVLFLGSSYENHFDRFEVLWALCYVDLAGGAWGPPGRFAWKHRRGINSPLMQLLTEAEQTGDAWPVLRAGLFQGSLARFKEAGHKLAQAIAKFGF